MREASSMTMIDGYDVDRQVGEVNGIAVEVWSAPTKGRAVLVAYPTKRGFTVISSGDVEDIPIMADLGGCLLRTLADVAPLLTGELFRGGRGTIDTLPPDTRQ